MATYISHTTNTTASSPLWMGWVEATPTTATTFTDIWPTWVEGTGTSTVITTSTTITAQVMWNVWCESGSLPVLQRQATPEQVAARQLAAAATTARLLECERQRVAAEARAERLLVENLSPVQRLEYARSRSFVVDGHAGRRFRIRHGRSGNVDLVGPDGRISQRLCAHPNLMLPNADTMLAQKLLLDADEDAFLRLANRHPALDSAPVLPALH